jgi:hypothetical protein
MKHFFLFASLLFVSASLSAQTPSAEKKPGGKNQTPASGKVKLPTEVKEEKSSTTAPGKVKGATEVKGQNTGGTAPSNPNTQSSKKAETKKEVVVPTNVVPGKPVKPSEPKAPSTQPKK